MPERIRLFLPAILIIALAVSWTEQASGAAEECILKPSAPSPRGSHWYYSVDRSTRQKCWYLGPEGMKVRAPARQTEALRPPPKSMLRPAEEESGATISTIAETPPGDARSSENELTLAASNYSAESLKESFTGELAPITTAYAEEENAASPQADKSLVWPIVTSAEFAGSTRQPDSVFTTATLLIVFSAALGVVYLIVHLLRGPLLASRPGRSSLDRSKSRASTRLGVELFRLRPATRTGSDPPSSIYSEPG